MHVAIVSGLAQFCVGISCECRRSAVDEHKSVSSRLFIVGFVLGVTALTIFFGDFFLILQ